MNDESTLPYLRDVTIVFNLLLRHDEVAQISCHHISRVVGGYESLIPSSKTDKLKEGCKVSLAEGKVFDLLNKY